MVGGDPPPGGSWQRETPKSVASPETKRAFILNPDRISPYHLGESPTLNNSGLAIDVNELQEGDSIELRCGGKGGKTIKLTRISGELCVDTRANPINGKIRPIRGTLLLGRRNQGESEKNYMQITTTDSPPEQNPERAVSGEHLTLHHDEGSSLYYLGDGKHITGQPEGPSRFGTEVDPNRKGMGILLAQRAAASQEAPTPPASSPEQKQREKTPEEKEIESLAQEIRKYMGGLNGKFPQAVIEKLGDWSRENSSGTAGCFYHNTAVKDPLDNFFNRLNAGSKIRVNTIRSAFANAGKSIKRGSPNNPTVITISDTQEGVINMQDYTPPSMSLGKEMITVCIYAPVLKAYDREDFIQIAFTIPKPNQEASSLGSKTESQLKKNPQLFVSTIFPAVFPGVFGLDFDKQIGLLPITEVYLFDERAIPSFPHNRPQFKGSALTLENVKPLKAESS